MNELRVLYIVLAVGVVILSVWGGIVLYRLSRVLDKLEKTLTTTNRISDMVESTVAGVVPVATGVTSMAARLLEYVKSFVAADSETGKKSK